MQRKTFPAPRPDWENTIKSEGLVFSQDFDGDDHYWNEFAAYTFTRGETMWLQDRIEEAHAMCLEAIDHIINGPLLFRLGLPDHAIRLALDSWRRREPDFYGRFDFIYNSDDDSLKLLEYNADTPTGIVEGAISQSTWFTDKNMHLQGFEEWNELGTGFVSRWRELRDYTEHHVLHLACVNDEINPTGEDKANLEVVAHAAKMAGWETHIIDIDQLFWDANNRIWHDAAGRRVRNLFKLYPWEDMVSDEYGKVLANGGYEAMDNWFEPAWKMFLSNKILLVALWELFPHHPILVPAYLDSPREMRDWVKKPLFGREGDGIVINAPSFDVHVEHTDGYITETATEEEYIYQAYVQAPNYLSDENEPNHPLLGAWVVDAESVAFAMREADGYITDYYSRFVPCMIERY
ncbi:glutathionylspermidine synthase family protein [Rothia terrae]|uniref:glutathionylspermidine synthase family protein n=1 Tax=Rothia terrae TaxID=396015 RepID=UPI0014455E01|nr:glutathionylspermidine synthase family protein [Rothia terrae]NKZ33674.1 glutathionylspermidine synthase family protein [Rothia terrae]